MGSTLPTTAPDVPALPAPTDIAITVCLHIRSRSERVRMGIDCRHLAAGAARAQLDNDQDYRAVRAQVGSHCARVTWSRGCSTRTRTMRATWSCCAREQRLTTRQQCSAQAEHGARVTRWASTRPRQGAAFRSQHLRMRGFDSHGASFVFCYFYMIFDLESRHPALRPSVTR